jgi:hypothetical protein
MMSVVGGIVQGIGAMQAGEAQAAQQEAQAAQAEAVAESHDYNVAVDERNVGVIREQTAAAIEDQQLLDVRTMATIQGLYASAGVTNTGSAMDVELDASKSMKLNRARIGYKGAISIVELRDDIVLEKMAAAQQRIGAQAYMDQAGASRTAGMISMVSGVLGGMSSAFSSMSRTA